MVLLTTTSVHHAPAYTAETHPFSHLVFYSLNSILGSRPRSFAVGIPFVRIPWKLDSRFLDPATVLRPLLEAKGYI